MLGNLNVFKDETAVVIVLLTVGNRGIVMIAVSAVVKNRIVKRLVGKYDLGENLIFSRITSLEEED